MTPVYRICKRFTVESGHMLSRHPDKCRYPHGHTRTVEVVVSAPSLDENGMVLDFKALSLALKEHIHRYDHAMAVNSTDPLLESIQQVYPDSLVIFDDQEPTTEAIAKEIFEFAQSTVQNGFVTPDGKYKIDSGRAQIERVRVWETPTSWAEFGC